MLRQEMEVTNIENSLDEISTSEQRFRLITDTIPHIVWEINPDGTFAYLNKQWLDWTGLSIEAVNEGGWAKIFHSDDRQNVVGTWEKAFESKTEFSGEYRMKNADGKYFWFLGKTVPVKNKKGEVVKWVGTSTNIDRQKKIEEALKESETQFRQLADVMPQQVWTANQKGELDYVNLVTKNYFGKSEEEIVGAGWQNVIHPGDLESVLKTWIKSLEDLTPYQVEFRLRGKDGSYRWHLGRATSFVNNNQVKWFGTNTDIEVHKANEERKDMFISMASHELKTPLTSIKGYAQLLQFKFEQEGNREDADLVKRMDIQINKLTKLIGDFLNVSKIEEQQFQLDKTDFNFKELVEECVSGAQLTAAAHQVIIDTNDDVVYHGDRLRLEQVFSNFLNNAIKYSPDATSIIVRSSQQFNNLVVSVQDFGIGIEKENLSKIFDRFYRVDNKSMKFQGLGLGLYISSEIIKAHNGSFWIESEFGKGSTFYFLLPLANQENEGNVSTDGETFYHNSQITIDYNSREKWLEVDWIGFQNYDSVKKGCLVMLDLLKKNKCSKVLNDNTHVLGNWSEAADWGGTVWFPAMQKAGLQFFAWIYSPSTFSKLAAHKSLDIMVGQITTQFFTEAENAKEWLKNFGEM
ncbi:MAG: PAS domain-containing sensor histidine kinase [Ginsengibacter sp.]